jgi:hypothetical protein
MPGYTPSKEKGPNFNLYCAAELGCLQGGSGKRGFCGGVEKQHGKKVHKVTPVIDRVSALVPVRFEIPCVLLQFAALR